MLTHEEIALKERIQHLLAVKRMTIKAFADNDERARTRYSVQITGGGCVPFNTIYKILYMFPDISAEWLVMGEGTMHKADHLAPRVYNTNNIVRDASAGGDINVGTTTRVAPSADGSFSPSAGTRVAPSAGSRVAPTSFVDLQTTIATQQQTIDSQSATIAALEKERDFLKSIISSMTQPPHSPKKK